MTFIQQVLASFIGTVFGFFFAILLFFTTNAIRGKFSRNTLRKHLKREFEYDITLVQEWIDEIDKILRKATANNREVFSYLRYTFFQRFFLQEAFRTGIMYNSLVDEDISNLNNILLHFDIGIEQYLYGLIQNWKNGQIVQPEALRSFEFEKEQLQIFKKNLAKISEKLNK